MIDYRPADFGEEGNNYIPSRFSRFSRWVKALVSRLTLLEKCLIVALSVLIVLTAILGAYIQSNSLQVLIIGSKFLQTWGNALCTTKACVTAAASILQTMDQSVKPCDDFYQYACGGWIRNTIVPEGKSLWGTFGIIEQQNQRIIKIILEQPSTQQKSEAEVKAKLYYQSCMDPNNTIEQLGGKPLQDVLTDVGGWNISGNFSINGWTLQKALHVLQIKYGMNGLFSWGVNEDDKNSSRYVIQIDQGGLTLPTRDHYLNKTSNPKVMDAYLEYMVQVGVLLGGEKNSTNTQMQQVIDFETELARITTPSDERRDEEKLYHSMSISELQKLAPFISWVDYFNEALRLVSKKIKPSDSVVIYAPEYLKNLTATLNNYTNTEEGKITLNNYLIWQMTHSLAFYLSKDFRNAFKNLRKVLTGTQGEDESWRYCVSDTNSVVGFAVGAMFVREKFSNNSKDFAKGMLDEIRQSLKHNIQDVSWMDSETKKAAVSKANAITDMIGFPEYILNPTMLDKKYQKLEIRENEYFENNIRAIKFNLLEMVQKLYEPVNKTIWGMTPPTVNAYYNPTKNQIVFPAGILQIPFFDVNNPSYLNFGGMGVVMGHELTHAFDDQGREYDERGNLNHWWNNNTIDNFKQQTQCIVDQYSKFQLDGLNLNGKQTLGENIADNGGLKAAFYAYRNWRQLKPELVLPGLELTPSQLFFVNFAQVWCSASTKEANQLQIEKDPHAPSQFRVNGPVSNFPEFAKLFDCPADSPMNPKEKCSVW